MNFSPHFRQTLRRPPTDKAGRAGNHDPHLASQLIARLFGGFGNLYQSAQTLASRHKSAA